MPAIALSATPDVIERRYFGLVHVARRVTEATGWKDLARAVAEGLGTALPSPADDHVVVRVWAITGSAAEELARHPAEHEFERVPQRELERAAQLDEPVPTPSGGALCGLRSGGVTLGVVEVCDPGVDDELLAAIAPIVAARFGVLADRADDLLLGPSSAAGDDASGLMAAFAAEARHQLEHDRLSAYLLIADGRAFERFAVTGSPIVPGEGVIIPFGDVGLRHVVITNRPIVSTDLGRDPRIVGREDRVIGRAGFHGLLSVPLRLQGRPIGVLNFVSRTPGFYRPEDVPIAQQIADQIAGFVGNLSAQQRMRTLIRQEAAEDERARVARDLYHVVGQTVPAIERAGLALSHRLRDSESEAGAEADRVVTLARRALADVRRAVADAVPRGLDAQTLEDAIRTELAFADAAPGPRGRLDATGDTTGLLGAVRRGAFRIFQEALTNAREHAGAETVQVTLRCARDLLLVVQDDGVGFQPGNADRSLGLGLKFMVDRAQALGGVLTVRGVPGSGTTVRFELLAARDAGTDGWDPGDVLEASAGATASIRVFVADRHPLVRGGLSRLVEHTPDLRLVGDAADAPTTRAQVGRLRPDVVLVDAALAQDDGDALLTVLRERAPGVAVVLLSEAVTLREEVLAARGVRGFLIKPVDQHELAEAIRAVAGGAQVSPAPRATTAAVAALTARERAILALMVAGQTNAEIGASLFLATKTVERQLATIVRKLGARNRAHATALAVARHLVEPPGA